ncbi:MAG TPA: hypothetical protein VFR23_19440 [Jiangellaceae bacterium]|nr:hypothetical protein [Jiangellaceae bacterium]
MNRYDEATAERIVEADVSEQRERVTALKLLGACQEAAQILEKYISELETRLESIRLVTPIAEPEDSNATPGPAHSALVNQLTALLSHLAAIQQRIRRLEQQVEL